MNATDVTGPCAAVHAVWANYAYVWQLKDEFQHHGKPIGWNAELWVVQFGY